MGSHTLGLLLSTWTTPSVLLLLLLQLLALPRPRPQAPVPLLARAHEHKKTGKALRRLPLPRPQPQHPPHLRNNPHSPFCCASSLHRPALLILILRQTELLVGPLGLYLSLSLPLWPQGRAEPGLPSSPSSSSTGHLSSPSQPMRYALSWPRAAWPCKCGGGPSGDYRCEGMDKRNKMTRSWRCWYASLNNEKVYIVCYCFWLFQSSSSITLCGLLLGDVSDVMKNKMDIIKFPPHTKKKKKNC